MDVVVSAGWKWTCGPYGTGFCWLRPELRDSLRRTQAYWLSMQTADELGEEQGAPALRDDLGARAFDGFGTANFFNFKRVDRGGRLPAFAGHRECRGA